MREGKACCRVLLAVVISLLLLLPLSLALPSAFEEDHSGNDLNELEAMLSGEHRGAGYVSGQADQADIYRSSQPSQYPPDPTMDPPFRNLFRNDTYFGVFIRELDGVLAPKTNLTWSEILLNGTLYLNTSGQDAEKVGRHHIKPILVKEPKF